MKTLTLASLLTGAFALLTFTGCSGGGGGGGGGQQNPGNQPGGVGINPAAANAVLEVRCKGQILLRDGNGRLAPLAGAGVIVTSEGVDIDSTIADRNGAYWVNLRRGQHNAVRAKRIGYEFEPAVLFVNPQGPEALPSIIGVAPGGNNPAAASGRVTMRFSGHAVTRSFLDQARIEIRNAATNRVVQNILVSGRDSVSITEPVGTELILTPSHPENRPWTPASARVRVTPDEQILFFRWPEPVLRAASPSPTPRPVLVPVPRPTPRPTFRVPATRPTATPVPRPIRYPIGQQ